MFGSINHKKNMGTTHLSTGAKTKQVSQIWKPRYRIISAIVRCLKDELMQPLESR